MTKTTIVWFRNDLRLKDHPALFEAIGNGHVIPLYILDTDEPIGGASQWWLHHSLIALDKSLRQCGSQLILRKGSPQKILNELVQQHKVDAVYWSRNYTPYAIKRDQAIKAALKNMNIDATSFQATMLFEPWDVANKQGGFFKVFTPFWRHCMHRGVAGDVLPAPAVISSPELPKSDALESFELLPQKPDWSGGFTPLWQPGEAGAQLRLEQFLENGLGKYAAKRDEPSVEATSKLSAHLHFGEISPRDVFRRVEIIGHMDSTIGEMNIKRVHDELGWREFSYYLLYHFQQLESEPFNRSFSQFTWEHNARHLRAWQLGKTGYPLVDAGMRELWHTGIMHNRVRMVAASFLTKHLLIHWHYGQEWFFDTLVDADLASNSASWQWVAGCGADAAPYFRIFNPITQSTKFDGKGSYIRKWIPELAHLGDKEIHTPWKLSTPVAEYPLPIVDHSKARERALKHYALMKEEVA